MIKLLKSIFKQIKYFIVNPLWISKVGLPLILVSLSLNGLIWYMYIKGYKDLIGLVPISYSLAALILNIFLANILYRKEILISIILLSSGLLIQIIYLIFLKFFAMSQAF